MQPDFRRSLHGGVMMSTVLLTFPTTFLAYSSPRLWNSPAPRCEPRLLSLHSSNSTVRSTLRVLTTLPFTTSCISWLVVMVPVTLSPLNSARISFQ